jgi:hypothetical protein
MARKLKKNVITTIPWWYSLKWRWNGLGQKETIARVKSVLNKAHKQSQKEA